MSVTGADQIRQKIQRIAKALDRGDVIQEAGQQWLDQDFVPLAQRLCPKESGYLASTIGGEAKGNELSVTADAPYAAYPEEGTSKQSAQPYMKPALRQTLGKLSSRIGIVLKRYV